MVSLKEVESGWEQDSAVVNAICWVVADSSMDVDMVDCCGEVMVGCF